MTTFILKIWDSAEGLTMEGAFDNPDAINEPPTPALVVGTYIGGHFDQIAKDGIRWFEMNIKKEVQEQPKIVAPRIILPRGDIEGAPI